MSCSLPSSLPDINYDFIVVRYPSINKLLLKEAGFLGLRKREIQVEKHRITPAYLYNVNDFDRVYPTISRSALLDDFKKQYPEKFVSAQKMDEKVSQVFEKWQKAYKFWSGDCSLSDLDKIQEECPDEVQQIRTHLWRAIQAEDIRLSIVERRRYQTWLKIIKVVLIICTIALLILLT